MKGRDYFSLFVIVLFSKICVITLINTSADVVFLNIVWGLNEILHVLSVLATHFTF